MGIYWSISGVIHRHTFARLLPTQWTVQHWIALVTTIVCQHYFNQRFSRYGRPQDIVVSAVFALCNGILETFCFLGMYNLGRVVLRETFSLSKPWAIFLGWNLYYIYSALIHVLFWLPLAFPQHTKPTAPPFHLHGLPLLTVMSMAWFIVYEMYNDVMFVCTMHMIIDAWAAWNIGLQGPFSRNTTPLRQKRHAP